MKSFSLRRRNSPARIIGREISFGSDASPTEFVSEEPHEHVGVHTAAEHRQHKGSFAEYSANHARDDLFGQSKAHRLPASGRSVANYLTRRSRSHYAICIAGLCLEFWSGVTGGKIF
jgi:hypothetical protein